MLSFLYSTGWQPAAGHIWDITALLAVNVDEEQSDVWLTNGPAGRPRETWLWIERTEERGEGENGCQWAGRHHLLLQTGTEVCLCVGAWEREREKIDLFSTASSSRIGVPSSQMDAVKLLNDACFSFTGCGSSRHAEKHTEWSQTHINTSCTCTPLHNKLSTIDDTTIHPGTLS